MKLLNTTYGKGRVRVMRIDRRPDGHDVRELTVQAMLTGDFDRAFTDADNSTSVSTDTVKNVVNVVARENLALCTEAFCAAVAEKLLQSYPQVETATVTGQETKWSRLSTDDARPHPHAFVLDANGKPFARVVASRGATRIASGINGFTFMKTTQSGWENFYKDPYTTLPETRDRLAATAMDASWRWQRTPADYDAANKAILATLLGVFADTYSKSIQDSLYRMATAALDAVPEIADVSLACPNKHYLLINLAAFGLQNENQVFLPTDEPHGQIECTVAR